AGRLSRAAVLRVLPRSDVADGETLCRRAVERRGRESDSRTEVPDSRWRVLPVGGVGYTRKHRLAYLAAQRGHCGTAVVTPRRYRCEFDVRASARGQPRTRRARADAQYCPRGNAASNGGIRRRDALARARRCGRAGEGLQPVG